MYEGPTNPSHELDEGNSYAKGSLDEPAFPIAERWADYTRAFAIYPESNQRVTETRSSFLEALESLKSGTETTLGIRFQGEEVRVGAEQFEVHPRTNLHWLAQRLETALLAGVGFQVDHLDDASLDGFTRHLLRIFSRKQPFKTFEEVWSTTFAGITLLERRFDGSFTDQQNDSEGSSGSGSGTKSLAEALLQSPDVRNKLENLREQFDPLKDESSATRSLNLVSMIVDRVPVDVMQSLERVHDLVVEILGTLTQQENPKPTNHREFEALLAKASQQFFARSGPQGAPAEDEGVAGAKGHSGDDAIADDLQSLIEEYKELPRFEDETSIDEALQDRLEQIGVYLYYAAHIESDRDRSRLIGAKLRRWLSKAGEEECELLKIYLDHLGDPEHSEKSERVLELIISENLGHLLRLIYPRSAEHVLRSFPDGFGLYLASVNPRHPAHRLELEGICGRITPARMSTASERFFKRPWELAPERVGAILDSGSSSLMGIAHVAIKNGGESLRPPVVSFLRKIELKAPEACLLWILEDLGKLSLSYLISITCPGADGRYPSTLREEVVESLCRFIQSIANDPEQTPRRIYAIKHLGHFPTETARRFLEDLLASRYFLIPKEPGSVRQAAKAVLRRLRA